MTIAHVATAATLRAELAQAESQVVALRDELAEMEELQGQAHQAGVAVLGALEVAMTPLMVELAEARNACGCPDPGPSSASRRLASLKVKPDVANIAFAGLGAGVEDARKASADEIRRRQSDIDGYRQQVEQMQAEDRERSSDISRLVGELSDAMEHLTYEQQRARHLEVCEDLGPAGQEGWAGMGPMGLGRRTLQARAEARLRETAEQRGCRLGRDVSRLASDVATQQATIKQLTKRLVRLQKKSSQKEKKLKTVGARAFELQSKMKSADEDEVHAFFGSANLAAQNAAERATNLAPLAADSVEAGTGTQAVAERGLDGGAAGDTARVRADSPGATARAAWSPAGPRGVGFSVASSGASTAPVKGLRRKGAASCASTGRLPQLSF